MTWTARSRSERGARELGEAVAAAAGAGEDVSGRSLGAVGRIGVRGASVGIEGDSSNGMISDVGNEGTASEGGALMASIAAGGMDDDSSSATIREYMVGSETPLSGAKISSTAPAGELSVPAVYDITTTGSRVRSERESCLERSRYCEPAGSRMATWTILSTFEASSIYSSETAAEGDPSELGAVPAAVAAAAAAAAG